VHNDAENTLLSRTAASLAIFREAKRGDKEFDGSEAGEAIRSPMEMAEVGQGLSSSIRGGNEPFIILSFRPIPGAIPLSSDVCPSSTIGT